MEGSSMSDSGSSENAIEDSLDENDEADIDIEMVSDSHNINNSDISTDSGHYSDEGSEIEIMEIDDDGYDSNLDIDLDDSDISSDWESGLSELDDSELDDSDDDVVDADEEYPGLNGNAASNRWFTTDGVEIFDDSDGEDRGIFRGIQHVPNDEYIFRIENNSSRSHRRGRNHHHHHGAIAPSIISLGNGGGRSRNMLVNPLGPHGMEEIEDIISNHQTGDNHTRRFSSGIIGGWLAETLLDDKSSDGIVAKSTTDLSLIHI